MSELKLQVIRAEEEWQRAGAYSVRIQGMNRQHKISLREEFDEHDGDGTRYIVLLDDGYPVGTLRFYELDAETVMVGRVVVLPEYRGRDWAAACSGKQRPGSGSWAIRPLRSRAVRSQSPFTRSWATAS